MRKQLSIYFIFLFIFFFIAAPRSLALTLEDFKAVLSAYLTIGQSPQDQNSDARVNVLDAALMLVRIFAPSPSPSSNPTNPPQPSPSGIVGTALYVSPNGSDTNNGSAQSPYKTIQKAVDAALVDSGDVSIVLGPGIYRQATTVANYTSGKKLQILSASGKTNTMIVGSESSKSLTWTKATDGLSFPSAAQSHIYRADVSSWNASPEMAFVTDNTLTQITRVPKAREPDWDVVPGKYSLNWWKAEGGTLNTLVDGTTDTAGSYPQATSEAGNISSINGFTGSFLTGARIFVKDTYSGHDEYMAIVTGHSGGTINLDRSLKYYSGSQLIGNNSKYYIEGRPQLLDKAGEWYYDSASKRLYIWPPQDVSPANQNLEFAVRPHAFWVHNAKNVTIKDLTLQFTNYTYGRNFGTDGAVRIDNTRSEAINNLTVDSLAIKHNGIGIRIDQDTEDGKKVENVSIKNSTVEYSDGFALSVFHWPLGATVEGVKNLYVEKNVFDTADFRPMGTGFGLWVKHPMNFVFRNNIVRHMSHSGMEIQGGLTSVNNVLVSHNIFEENCQNAFDCGGYKMFGGNNWTMHNVLISHNIARNNNGWSWIGETTNKWERKGYYAAGFYSDVLHSSQNGITCPIAYYRNLSYDNHNPELQLTASRDHCVEQNVFRSQSVGIEMNNAGGTDGQNSKIIGNIFNHYSGAGDLQTTDDVGLYLDYDIANASQLPIDKNIYQVNGTTAARDMRKRNLNGSSDTTLKRIPDIQSATPWEDNGRDTTSGTFPTIGNNYNLNTIFNSFGGANLTTPSEIQTLIGRLQTGLGITITDDTTAGLN